MSSQAFISNATASTLAAVGDGYSVPRMPTAQRLAIVFGASDQGMMVYDTTLNNLFIWNGSAWESVPASGDAGPNGAVQYNDGGVVVGDANLTWDKTAQKLKVGGFIDIWKGNNGDTYSVGVGSTSLGSTQPGAIGNTAIGYRSQYRATTGSQNTSVGYNTLSALAFSGDSNTAVGFGAGNAITTGAGNVIVGGYSGNSGGLDIRTASNYVVLSDGNGTLKYSADGSGVQNWYVGGSTAMTLNSTGLGVGANPLYRLHVSQSQVGETNIFVDNQQNDPAALSGLWLSAYGGTWKISVPRSATFVNPLIFKFGSTEMMRLDASGNLLVGTTSLGVGNANAAVIAVGSNAGQIALGHVSGTASGQNYANFLLNSVTIGSITQNGATGVLYNITSDYRLKESVQPLVGGLARVNALKPSVYKWKSDGSNGEGFLAHELAEVVPFAVSGEKDAVNEDGSIKSQGIDMSRVVPILVAAIQELTARVQTLETR